MAKELHFEKIGGCNTCWYVNTIEERQAKITELANRPIQWDLILSLQHHGKLTRCELCGNEQYGGFWCSPCIHHSWCCVCCILLGVPNYATGVYVITEGK